MTSIPPNVTTMSDHVNYSSANVTGSGNFTMGSTKVELNYEVIATSFICCVGIVGNVSNIVVLRMRRTQVGLDLIGRSAILGLLALAASDLMFCVIGVFSGLLLSVASGDLTSGGVVRRHVAVVGFAYSMYRGALINVFLFVSTWCITLLSLERYLVVCHPFRSRSYVNARLVIGSRLIVLIVSIAVNMPLFVRFTIRWEQCDENTTCIYSLPQVDRLRQPLMRFHLISWATVGTFVPLAILIFANARLIREVLRVKRDELRRNGKAIFHVTKTLVVIAISFIVLVCPSMMLDFLGSHHLVPTGRAFNLALKLTNICQALKFSCNFLLYCTLNRSFRQNLC